MAAKITATGVYDLTMPEYLGQPADALSISSSDAGILEESTPAHLRAAWAERESEGTDSKEADLGTVIHTLILEPHRKDKALVVVDAKDWRTKAAQEAREAAKAEGRIAILPAVLAQAEGAVAAVMAHPVAAHLLAKGRAEQSWFAKDKETGLYRKARTDFYNAQRIIVDIKTVGSAAPDFLQRRVFEGGWFQQAPWHCDVVERVEGSPAAGYCWLIVEQKPPHCVVVRRPPDTVLMHGHRVNQRAFAVFARCAKTGQWPGWSDTIEDLTLPSYALFRLEEDGVVNENKTGFEALAWARETGGHVYG